MQNVVVGHDTASRPSVGVDDPGRRPRRPRGADRHGRPPDGHARARLPGTTRPSHRRWPVGHGDGPAVHDVPSKSRTVPPTTAVHDGLVGTGDAHPPGLEQLHGGRADPGGHRPGGSTRSCRSGWRRVRCCRRRRRTGSSGRRPRPSATRRGRAPDRSGRRPSAGGGRQRGRGRPGRPVAEGGVARAVDHRTAGPDGAGDGRQFGSRRRSGGRGREVGGGRHPGGPVPRGDDPGPGRLGRVGLVGPSSGGQAEHVRDAGGRREPAGRGQGGGRCGPADHGNDRGGHGGRDGRRAGWWSGLVVVVVVGPAAAPGARPGPPGWSNRPQPTRATAIRTGARTAPVPTRRPPVTSPPSGIACFRPRQASGVVPPHRRRAARAATGSDGVSPGSVRVEGPEDHAGAGLRVEERALRRHPSPGVGPGVDLGHGHRWQEDGGLDRPRPPPRPPRPASCWRRSARGRAARPAPGPPWTDTRSEPAASAVPSRGVSIQQPDGITRASADDSPRAAVVRSVHSPARATSNQESKASTRSRPSGRPDSRRWMGPTDKRVLGQLDHQGQHAVGPRGAGPRHRPGRSRRWPGGGARRPPPPAPSRPRRRWRRWRPGRRSPTARDGRRRHRARTRRGGESVASRAVSPGPATAPRWGTG